MRVGIVGAGICGLSAARRLKQEGIESVLFEKAARVGGRAATYSAKGFTWDTGATSIAPRGKAIEQVILHELDTSDLVTIEKPIYLLHSLRVMSSGSGKVTPRYTYRSGIATLPKLLAQNLDVRLSTQVETIARTKGGYQILGEQFDAVILAPPIPQTSALLWSLEESRPLASVFYRACLNIALGYDRPLPDVHYHALLDPEQRHPLTWLSLESVKSPGRCPEGGAALCAQLSPQYSLDNYKDKDEDLVSLAAYFVSRIFGDEFLKPVASAVKRWKYSQPESFANAEDVNPPGSKVLIASDSLLGGHIEDAFQVGRLVAERLFDPSGSAEA